MNFSLEKLNKNLLLVAILSLIYRKGSFAALGVPKPFEVLFVLVVLIAIIDILRNKKFIEFIKAIPKKIWIALIVLTTAIVAGWGMSVWWNHMPTTGNMLLEFATYVISVVTFLVVIFYTRNDKKYARWYLYALSVSVVFVPILIYPPLANILGLSDGPNNALNGFTDNVSISSRMFLIPAIFFFATALVEQKNRWVKVLHTVLAAGSAALVFWAVERGAILAMLLGMFCVWCIYICQHFRFKKMILSGLLSLGIVILGFLITPGIGKRIVLNRVLNPDTEHSNFADLKEKTVLEIAQKSSLIATNSNTALSGQSSFSSESRLVIWPYYIRLAAQHPFGIGPNTHVDARIDYQKGAFHNPGPHNAYIQVFLWGGIVALLSFAYLILFSMGNMQKRLNKSFGTHDLALLGIVITLAIAIIFNDSLQLYTFWIVLALALQPWKNH